MIINSLQYNKAPEEDNANLEFIKLTGPDLAIQIQKLIRRIWINKQIPKDWNTYIVYLTFKNGNRVKPENYRGISFLDTVYKVVSFFVLTRIEIYAQYVIEQYQRGVIRGMSTIDHIFTLRQIIEKYYEYDKDLFMIFVDFKQAHNNINIQQLRTALRNF